MYYDSEKFGLKLKLTTCLNFLSFLVPLLFGLIISVSDNTQVNLHGYTFGNSESDPSTYYISASPNDDYTGESIYFREDNSISFRGDTFSYKIEGTKKSFNLEITYPDGFQIRYVNSRVPLLHTKADSSATENTIYVGEETQFASDQDLVYNVIVAKELCSKR